ncbi:MAG TPA: AAA family ATPase [Burkholderiales bacterium]|nr:AAA family ATPase [Burkholderiales bacterium]
MSLYLEHFGLNEAPFRITPHTDFFFDGADRGTTLEALQYATLHEEGIVKVVGEVGSGKTMLCRMLMERLPPHVETIYLANPSVTRDEVLLTVADELKVAVTPGRATGVLHALQERLIESFARGRRTVVLIDEAHAMPEDALEQVRLLSNLETSRHKLLQIVLFGQSELDDILDKSSMRQLKDRITHSFRTRPLSAAEVATYVSFRMRAAGYRGPEVFTPQALTRIARASGGLTRRINILADKSLLAAFSEGTHAVTAKQVRAAVGDSEFAPRRRQPLGLWLAAGAGAAGLLVGLAAYRILEFGAPGPGPAPVQASGEIRSLPVSRPPPAPQPPDSHAAPAMASVAAAVAVLPSRPPPSLLDRDQEAAFAGYSAARLPLLTARLSATHDKLAAAPDNRMTLELYISDNSDPARVERFLQRARDLVPLENLYVVPVPEAGKYRIWAVYGDFADAASAAQAAKRLPPRYQKAFPLTPRPFSDIRRVL